MHYTLGQAAKATGKSKSVVQRAIKNGTISAVKDGYGQYQIEASELHRVFPITVPDTPEKNEPEHHQNTELLIENATLKARLDALSELNSQIQGERDNLRDQNSRLTALLSAPVVQKHGFWSRLMGGKGVVCLVAILTFCGVPSHAMAETNNDYPNKLDLQAAYCLELRVEVGNQSPKIDELLKEDTLRLRRYLAARGFFSYENIDAAERLLTATAQAKDDYAAVLGATSSAFNQCFTECLGQNKKSERETFMGCQNFCKSLRTRAENKVASCQEVLNNLPF
jgi:excisionase family DNA binding protein